MSDLRPGQLQTYSTEEKKTINTRLAGLSAP